MQRSEFVQKYQSATGAAPFVDAVLETMHNSSGVNLSAERERLIGFYNTGQSSNEARSLVLRELAANASFAGAVYNQSFVLMEYFGYLRRDADQGGYDFWLNVLNHAEPGNYRGMVCSFITSAEYQRRFGTLVAHANSECSGR